jgi:hypothetical protein
MVNEAATDADEISISLLRNSLAPRSVSGYIVAKPAAPKGAALFI